MDKEALLASWTKPSSGTEQDKQERTERMIRQAITNHPVFGTSDVSVYAKGSYPNNTNVKTDSDVDIAVQCSDLFYYENPNSSVTVPVTSYEGSWTPVRLRNELQRALEAMFGGQVDASGSVAIKVSSGTARVEADVVPCFDYRRYWTSRNYNEGIRIYRKNGNTWTDNYPQQHLSEGRAKNTETNTKYKKAVRILKRSANEMHANSVHRATVSYFVESLVYNCPNSLFSNQNWTDIVSSVLVHIWENAQGDAEPIVEEQRWLEADGIKFLFHGSQEWNRRDAREFAYAAWHYLDLGT